MRGRQLVWIFLLLLTVLTCNEVQSWQGPEPEADFARIGISTLIATTTNTWTCVPSTTAPPSSGRNALYLDLPAGTTVPSLRIAFTTSTLTPNQQYAIAGSSTSTPGELVMLASDPPLRLDINESIFVWVCTTSTLVQPPVVRGQEFKPRN